MTTIVLSSKAGFESASALADALGCKYENPFETGNRDYRAYSTIIKYGFSRPIKTTKGSLVINKTSSTELALDKVKTFALFEGENLTVPYTLSLKEAAKWLKDGTVVARETATGHNSEGIKFCDTGEELIEANAVFFTKWIKSTNEFRVNVWRNKVVSVYDKVENNGIFSFKLFKGVEEHPQLVSIVEKVYEKTALDWYGLDVLRDKKGNLMLLEINSAPVLYPYTLKKLSTILEKEVV